MAKPKIRKRTKKIALVNQKGGVGKTTSTINLGAALVDLGARVLVRDMDPQANASTTLLGGQVPTYTMNDLLKPDDESREVVEGSLASAILKAGPEWPAGLYVVASALGLQGREQDADAVERDYRLANVSAGATDAFDVVLTDCPPAPGQITMNALCDSDEVWIVTRPTKYGVEGTHEAYRTVERVRKRLNPNLTVFTILVNAFRGDAWATDGRAQIESRARLAELRERYGDLVNPVIVPESEVINKAIGADVPLATYDSDGRRAARNFKTLAATILES